MPIARTEIPDWIKIPTSELGVLYKIGHVVGAWLSNIKVEFFCPDGKIRIGIYSITSHQILVPTLTDWVEYAEEIEIEDNI